MLFHQAMNRPMLGCAPSRVRARGWIGIFARLLNLSEMEAGTFVVSPVTLQLSRLIELQLFEIQAVSKRKGIPLTYDIENPALAVEIDEYCLKHALANLLHNAIKFTKQGHIQVKAYCDADSRTCIDVEDTGIGMSASYLSNLFQPFSQENGATTRNYSGMGLGLALAKRYLTLNQADLSIRSAKQVGTTCTIRLGGLQSHGHRL